MDNVVKKIIAYENGEMNEEEMIVLFQEMVDSGIVWKLQGHYGRTASALIESGQVNGSVRHLAEQCLNTKIKSLTSD